MDNNTENRIRKLLGERSTETKPTVLTNVTRWLDELDAFIESVYADSVTKDELVRAIINAVFELEQENANLSTQLEKWLSQSYLIITRVRLHGENERLPGLYASMKHAQETAEIDWSELEDQIEWVEVNHILTIGKLKWNDQVIYEIATEEVRKPYGRMAKEES